MKTIISVVGARPNFIKIAPIHKAFKKYVHEIRHLICHTGQHFDDNLSRIFFEELELPEPDFYLGIGGGSHAWQTGRIMEEFEKVMAAERPDMILVPGDVNSTLAASLVAAKMTIQSGHIEAGLRSFDRSMPEEVNRIVTDTLSNLLFVSERSGLTNLSNEGIPEKRIFFTGNVMIDSLVQYQAKFKNMRIQQDFGVEVYRYMLATFHRPANVDQRKNLAEVVKFLNRCGEMIKTVFVIHPRTSKMLREYNLLKKLSDNIILSEPLGYLEFLALTDKAALVVTDSGGIQEETTFLKIPCITVRNSTERPVTVTEGTNYLAGTDLKGLEKLVKKILDGGAKQGNIPEMWDGKVAERITEIVVRKLTSGE